MSHLSLLSIVASLFLTSFRVYQNLPHHTNKKTRHSSTVKDVQITGVEVLIFQSPCGFDTVHDVAYIKLDMCYFNT